MRLFLTTCLLASLAAAATAKPIDTRNIVTALSGDFNGDGAQDLVMLVQQKPSFPMEMHFFLRDKEHNYLKEVDVVGEVVHGEWTGWDSPGYSASDTEPDLTLLPNGSIRVFIPAAPVGSARTDETFTLAYRDGTFIVAGYGYEYVDYLDESVGGRCDYNVVTGKGVRAKKKDGKMVSIPIAVAGKAVAFRDWLDSGSASACEG